MRVHPGKRSEMRTRGNEIRRNLDASCNKLKHCADQPLGKDPWVSSCFSIATIASVPCCLIGVPCVPCFKCQRLLKLLYSLNDCQCHASSASGGPPNLFLFFYGCQYRPMCASGLIGVPCHASSASGCPPKLFSYLSRLPLSPYVCFLLDRCHASSAGSPQKPI
eukprot:1158596-Pelagomonas_calceolata.AAC.4